MADASFRGCDGQARVGGGGFSAGAARWISTATDGWIFSFALCVYGSRLPAKGRPGSKGFGYRDVQMSSRWGTRIQDPAHRNRGDGTFEEVSVKAGVSNPDHRLGMGVCGGGLRQRWPAGSLRPNDMSRTMSSTTSMKGTFEDLACLGRGAWRAWRDTGKHGLAFGDVTHDGALGFADYAIRTSAAEPISLTTELRALWIYVCLRSWVTSTAT